MKFKQTVRQAAVFCIAAAVGGCVVPDPLHPTRIHAVDATPVVAQREMTVALVAHRQLSEPARSSQRDEASVAFQVDDPVVALDSAMVASFAHDPLTELESQALAFNPRLRQLQQEYQAARAKVRYVDELPDPTIGANVLVHPIETAAGSQRANLSITQMVPWLPRLNALEQQACLEAIALNEVIAVERLRVTSDIRALWYRLYVIEKQTQINSANQQLLKSLIKVANSRVATGNASQGDVLAGTLAYSKLEETLIGLRLQRVSAIAQVNRLVGRDASTPIESPAVLRADSPQWDHAQLVSLALMHQPEIELARIRTQATRWGVEVARLKRRPDFSLSASWFAIDDNRPQSAIVDVGRDAWSLGAMMTIPLGHEKYDAIEQQARWTHAASHSSVEQVTQQFDALLLDLLAQAQAARETASLYQNTIIPEARRTLDVDQAAYLNGQVEFDRVVRDFRNLLTLELGYHRTLGQLATAVARMEQATGADLQSAP